MRAVVWLALLALGWVLIVCGLAGSFGSFLACFVAPSAVDEQGVINQEAEVQVPPNSSVPSTAPPYIPPVVQPPPIVIGGLA